MQITIQKILDRTPITTKEGRSLTKTKFTTTAGENLDTFASVQEGMTYDGEVVENIFGRTFRLRRSGRGMNAALDKEYLEKKNELTARQTALNSAIAIVKAKIEAGDKKISGPDVFRLAESYLKWLRGEKIAAR